MELNNINIMEKNENSINHLRGIICGIENYSYE